MTDGSDGKVEVDSKCVLKNDDGIVAPGTNRW